VTAGESSADSAARRLRNMRRGKRRASHRKRGVARGGSVAHNGRTKILSFGKTSSEHDLFAAFV
jgi:hypothetical protein